MNLYECLLYQVFLKGQGGGKESTVSWLHGLGNKYCNCKETGKMYPRTYMAVAVEE